MAEPEDHPWSAGHSLGNAAVTDIILLFSLSALHIFLSFAINSYYWATITSNLVMRVFD
jgi:hypothetical protein